ncbi:MAG: amino acid permease [Acetilactobacillus jinshanensis]
MTNGQHNNQLAHGLKPRHVQLIALGGAIGTGLFLGAGQSIKLAGPSIIFAYLIAGLVCFLIMRALGELLISNPNCRSYIDFITKYLGRKNGFVVGWTYWICWITIAMAEITASGMYMKFWFPHLPQWVTGLVVLVILFILNSKNVSVFGETEFWFAIIKIVAIVMLILTGIIMVIVHYRTNVGFASVFNLFNYGFFSHGIKGFLLSFQMVVFSFVGIEMIGMTAAETENPRKEIPKCINSVPTRILLFYVGSLLALMCIYPWIYISASSSPFVQVFANVGIKFAAAIINFVVLTAALSSCNSAIFTTGRMVFSLCYDHQSKWGRRFSTLSKKHHVPTYAIGFSTLIIAISVLLNLMTPSGVFSFVSSVSTTCFLYIWGMIVLTHLHYRRTIAKDHLTQELNFKMPGYPVSDYLALMFLVFVMIILIFKPETLVALIGSLSWLIIMYCGYSIYNRVDKD